MGGAGVVTYSYRLGRHYDGSKCDSYKSENGFTANQTKALADFFGKGADGAKALIEATGKPGYTLPKGVTEVVLNLS